jgi:hypothetical protein
MKKILFILLIIPFWGSAQTKSIDGFWGIKFGTSKSEAATAMKAKGATPSQAATQDNLLSYEGVNFAQRKTFLVMLKFANDKLYDVRVVYQPENNEPISQFEAMVKELKIPYGETTVFRNFDEPYKHGDGHELTAIKVGKAQYAAFWSTVNSAGDKNFISLKIAKDLYIDLDYQDGTIVKNLIAERNESKTSDY